MSRAYVVSPKALTGIMRGVLAKNLRDLIDRRYQGLTTVTARVLALAKDSKTGHGTIQRALSAENSTTLDTIERLAVALDVSVYQLLLPNLHPDDPQEVPGAMAAERSIHAAFRKESLGLTVKS